MLIAAQRTQSLFQQIGGEDGIRALVETFYDIIEQDPEAAALHDLHLQGQGVANSRPEQFNFLCGFFGGRRYYHELHGHMNLREIHAHVEIRLQDAEDWLAVMDRAMVETNVAETERGQIMATFRRAALMLVNVE